MASLLTPSLNWNKTVCVMDILSEVEVEAFVDVSLSNWCGVKQKIASRGVTEITSLPLEYG